MRKSRLIRLVLLGSAGFALSACERGPPADAAFFEDLPACSARLGDEKCARAFERAMDAHLSGAPVSLLEQECENDFGEGNCEPRYMPSDRPYYVPAMKGFMTAGGSFSGPVYRERDGSAVVPDGDSIYRVGRFTQGFVTGVRVRSAAGQDTARDADAGPRTLFQREAARRISDRGFAARAKRGGLASTPPPQQVKQGRPGKPVATASRPD